MLSRTHLKRLRAEPAAPSARLRFAMTALSLTQEELERLSGVSQSTISNILRDGQQRPTVLTAAKLSAALGCELQDLFPMPASDEAIA